MFKNFSELNLLHIPTELVECYRCANYEIGADFDKITLHIDQYSEQLSQFFETSNSQTAAVITAYNPFGVCLSSEENLIAHRILGDALKHYLSPIIESVSTDPSGMWPAEKGFFAVGLSLDTAKMFGQQFNQNAIVWMNATAVPRLILLPRQV